MSITSWAKRDDLENKYQIRVLLTSKDAAARFVSPDVRVALIYFFLDGCGPCEGFYPEYVRFVQSLRKTGSDEKLLAVYLVDTQAGGYVMKQMGVQDLESYPTVFVRDCGGTGKSKAAFEKVNRGNLAGSYRAALVKFDTDYRLKLQASRPQGRAPAKSGGGRGRRRRHRS